MGDKNSKIRWMEPGQEPVMCDTMKYARQLREGMPDSWIEELIDGQWVRLG
jgi:hypothetical protein